ncbi:MAG TPA: hypothetical protein VGC07_01125 [Granulicella sp.]
MSKNKPGRDDRRGIHAVDPQSYPKQRQELSLWFFCGILLLSYGLILIVHGIYERFGHQPATVLAALHPTLWWGILLAAGGAFYTLRFRPRSR